MHGNFASWLRPGIVALVVGTGSLLLPVVSPALAQGVDINAIFNCEADGPLGEQTPEQCDATRSQLLSTCTSCHTFVPIVKAQKTPEGWGATLEAHRAHVPAMSEEDREQMSLFLKAHFNDTLPPPALPPELEALGTGQAF